jgi:Zn-dependent M16 (insulinase) family peptidase
VIKSDVVQEYGAKVTYYRHRKTGAEILSVSVDDDNKVRWCSACGVRACRRCGG